MKKIFLFAFLTSLIFALSSGAQDAAQPLKNKNIIMIIPDMNFQEDELFIPEAYFKKRGANVTLASSKIGEHTGMAGKTVTTETLYLDIDPVNYDAVIFIGGTGSVQYWDDLIAHSIVKNTVGKKKILGAICLAPMTLANAGVLKDKNATIWSDAKDQFIQKGAKYQGEGVFVDGNIVTASGPKYAEQFAEEISKLLLTFNTILNINCIDSIDII
ncbi:MAG: DJ-1/PfpI family protein [Candidatus Omnitrophica bacterium]|nr:DJ-1/PfpI family protein [Candidatus Omnitrophota bacterium]